ncbi:hypothetical protein [Peptoniphilus catoniae]|uniref:hypothetical protein n=1 Tax=Peptoniphilus catoniae TaxID=1660341 RepID=UPI0010FDD0AE|nr:hypothetical protein [Peptoniphilus catoniae]
MKFLKKSLIKVVLLLFLALILIRFLDLRDYVAYEKMDGKVKIEEIKEKNKNIIEVLLNKLPI